jgi:hypothetical protein
MRLLGNLMSRGQSMHAQRDAGYAVGPQYSSTHVYAGLNELDALARSITATLGGEAGDSYTAQVTPTPSQTIVKPLSTPAGNIVLFAFTTPVPYPFGTERTGHLVSDMDGAIASARACGADVVVSAFPDAVGRDAVLLWPGGVWMQIYSHNVAPHYPALVTVPENRVYISPQAADLFVRGFVGWAKGRVTSDDEAAPGVEIGRQEAKFRRIRITSDFGNAAVFVTDGALPYPFGRELTGYEVPDLEAALRRGTAEGLKTLVAPFHSDNRSAAVVQFPGGFIAELHCSASHFAVPASVSHNSKGS